ncbi:uncharacterized protein LOC123295096 isoform X4 [Chrysoperla carnea]|uniref:uncharacterized protein LOC123295096 isoform X3 n=1 Tax=Chrysoperla carnea TaxID=189513 RepID=UPI001D095336|nr:uncharacterized protein LOC123295096 isoform X3 [Chrysoperla carnea]XP_044732250.1 uncharacterized protein LOC123295096 isoform X4 [Chrysoperla carnea]
MEMIREWVNHTEPNLGYKEGFVDDADEDKDKDNSQNRNEIEEEKNDRMKDLDTRQTKSNFNIPKKSIRPKRAATMNVNYEESPPQKIRIVRRMRRK